LSRDENDKYLGLGIADTLITRLGGTKEIIVRPTSSIQKYDSVDQDSIAAGREQQVDAVLEGSIQKSGDKMRVTVRLLSVMDGSTLWTYKSDEDFVDVFALEDSVSDKLVNALALNLTSQDKQRLAKHYTGNTEAYQLYAKGVFLRNLMTEEGLLKSIDCFRRARELDPQYALAYAGQASSNSPLAFFGFITMREAESRNRQLITKALELDGALAEAHAAQGEFKLFIEWDWAGAERAFKRALELNPNEQLTHLLYPDLLLLKGQTNEAIAMGKAAFEMDPLSARTGKALAHVYYYAAKYDQALEQSKEMLDLFPNYRLIFLGPIYEQKGMYDEAIKEYLRSEEQWGLSQINVIALRQAYAATGWRGYWQKRLELLKSEAEHKPVAPLQFAELYARLGDKEKAFEWLEKSYNNREMALIFVKVDPTWESLHSDPRFGTLLQRMGLGQ
jgi:TolB-like protein